MPHSVDRLLHTGQSKREHSAYRGHVRRSTRWSRDRDVSHGRVLEATDPEVSNLGAPLSVDENVLRLEIAMQDAGM